MSCTCIEDLNKLVREKYGDPEASLDCGFALDLSQKPGEHQGLDVYPSMSATYRAKSKNGSFGVRKHVSVRGDYCPFCGKAYSDAARSPDALPDEE